MAKYLLASATYEKKMQDYYDTIVLELVDVTIRILTLVNAFHFWISRKFSHNATENRKIKYVNRSIKRYTNNPNAYFGTGLVIARFIIGTHNHPFSYQCLLG